MSDDNREQYQDPAASVPAQPQKKDGWERELLEKLAFASLKEQRARRRWGIFFKLSTLAIVVLDRKSVV